MVLLVVGLAQSKMYFDDGGGGTTAAVIADRQVNCFSLTSSTLRQTSDDISGLAEHQFFAEYSQNRVEQTPTTYNKTL